jgi:hypothetical protein
MILDNFIVEPVIGLVDGAEHNAAFFISVCSDYGARYFARRLDRAASAEGNIAHAVHAHEGVVTRSILTAPHLIAALAAISAVVVGNNVAAAVYSTTEQKAPRSNPAGRTPRILIRSARS